MTSDGEPFYFLPTTPDVLFCKESPPMKKVIMVVQPDSPQSASKQRQTSGSAAPQVQTKKRKIIARRVIKKTAQPSPNQSESNTNQVIHSSETSSLRIYILVDCNPIFRTQLETPSVLEAQHNREPPFMKPTLEQLKSKNSKNQPSFQQKFAAKELQQLMYRWKFNPGLPMLRWRCVTNRLT